MAKPNRLQRKQSSVNLEGKAMIKRRFSERTLIANEMESCLSLGNASPIVMEAQQDNGDSKSKISKPDIERECRPESENDDHDVANKQVSFAQEVVDDVPIKTKTTEYELEGEGEDEADGRERFLGRIAEKAVDLLAPHHHHHHDEGFSIHLPTCFHQFDTPCPFGARLRRSDEGCTVVKILSDTVAHKAGLRESDVVTYLNDNDLKSMGDININKLFMHVDTVFTLTFLRKRGEGDDVHVMKTIKVTIADKIEVEVMHVEMIRSWKKLNSVISTSALIYIIQKGDDRKQVYLNATENEVTMGDDTGDTAKFYLDFIVVSDTANGQRCFIRNAKTNKIYDAVQNNMKQVEDHSVLDQACMLDKTYKNGVYLFESVERRGHYLTRHGASMKLSNYPDHIPPRDVSFFDVISV